MRNPANAEASELFGTDRKGYLERVERCVGESQPVNSLIAALRPYFFHGIFTRNAFPTYQCVVFQAKVTRDTINN